MRRFRTLLGLTLAVVTVLVINPGVRAEEQPFRVYGSGGLDLSSDPTIRGLGLSTQLGRCALSIPLDSFALDYEGDLVPLGLRLHGWPANQRHDYIDADVNATFDPETGMLVGTVMFTGGSGRFADATGSATLLIMFHDWTGPDGNLSLDFVMEGTIEY
jgi:hypothetical protein